MCLAAVCPIEEMAVARAGFTKALRDFDPAMVGILGVTLAFEAEAWFGSATITLIPDAKCSFSGGYRVVDYRLPVDVQEQLRALGFMSIRRSAFHLYHVDGTVHVIMDSLLNGLNPLWGLGSIVEVRVNGTDQVYR